MLANPRTAPVWRSAFSPLDAQGPAPPFHRGAPANNKTENLVPIAVDQPVPDFTAAATGGDFTLSSLRGKKVVLYFYPKDNTPGCTTEGLQFRDLYPKFTKAGAEIVGVSRDSVRSHDNFKSKLELPFTLVSDPEETLCLLFGVMKLKKMYGKEVRGIERSTFLIDGDGVLRHEWRGVKVPGHVDEILETVQGL
ncbi:Peroxiredoxin [Paraburkholderia saeva]|nr:Peroxiredoxin [Paraburkholderia saeva]CAG4895522.1 Peroxiredoxin [Paraburkholderia saeva]